MAAIMQGRGSALITLLLGAIIFFVLAVVVPIALKIKSSHRSALSDFSTNIEPSSDSRDEDDEESRFSAFPTTNLPYFNDVPTFFIPDFENDDATSNEDMREEEGYEGETITFLRPRDTPQPTGIPSFSPSNGPSQAPSASPTTDAPSDAPSHVPSSNPSVLPTDDIAFLPGLLTHEQNGLLLSQGLRSRIIAVSGRAVPYENTTYGKQSTTIFHSMPDFGATFVDRRPDNPGGWIYLSNSEMEAKGTGGVGAVTFDRNGNV